MQKIFLSFTLALFLAPSSAGTPNATGHTKFVGVYRLYGGGLGDPVAPTRRDTKIVFSVTGDAAREMFGAMGPDVRDECTAGSGLRMRKKDSENIVCIQSKQGMFSCNFGFDLNSGKSIGGIVC